MIGSRQPGRRWTLLREHPRDRVADGEPETGLIIRWYPEQTLDLVQEPPGELLSELDRHLASCGSKSCDYVLDRCVLVLDPHGEIRHLPDIWWHQVFRLRAASRGISEIWTGVYDWVTDRDQAWLFEKIYPVAVDDRTV